MQMSEQKNCYLVHVPYDAGSGFVDEKIIEKFISSGGVGGNKVWLPSEWNLFVRKILKLKKSKVGEEEYQIFSKYILKSKILISREQILERFKQKYVRNDLSLHTDKSLVNWYYVYSEKPNSQNNNKWRLVYEVPYEEWKERSVTITQSVQVTPYIIPYKYLLEDIKIKFNKSDNDTDIETQWKEKRDTMSNIEHRTMINFITKHTNEPDKESSGESKGESKGENLRFY
jgi:hypothetical protein